MPEARHFVALNEVNTLRVAPAGAGAVELLLVDDVFAPGHESLTIAYAVNGPVAAARLEVRCPLHGSEPLFVAPLSPDDLHPGTRYTFAWDGITTCKSGELAGNYVNPLYAPYEVVIVYDDGTGESETPARSFVVRYHSLTIDIGPWTADHQPPPAEQRDKWLRYHLNKAGFWAGPVEEDLDDGLSKAIKRYKHHHPRAVRGHASEYDDEIDEALEKDLVAGRHARATFMPETGNALRDPSAESRILIEAIFAEVGEMSSGRKLRDKVLNRPVLPIEVRILLKSKSGDGVDSPLAVGSVRVDLHVDDVAEDLTRQVSTSGASPSRARQYVQRVHDIFDTPSRRNCPVDNGGISEEDGSWQTAVVLGAAFPPFLVHADSSTRRVFCHAAPADATPPAAAGRAGFLFRPSIIAGDGYRVTATLNFGDRANAADLTRINGASAARTGTLRIWRELPIASRVLWGAGPSIAFDLSFVRERYAPAYTHIGGALRPLRIEEVLDSETYRSALRKRTVPNPDRFYLEPGGLYGAPLDQGTETGGIFRSWIFSEMHRFYRDTYAESGVHRPWSELGWPVRKIAQKQAGYGIHVVEYSLHVPVTIWSGPGPDRSVLEKDYVVVIRCFAGESGVVFIDQNIWKRISRDPDDPPEISEDVLYGRLVAHELGHTLLLEHQGDSEDLSLDDFHDRNDDACMMQPEVLGQRNFCGKCVLSLRGWSSDRLPAGSG